MAARDNFLTATPNSGGTRQSRFPRLIPAVSGQVSSTDPSRARPWPAGPTTPGHS
ncbi:MAG: hypothetical protein JWM17_912 [Actinobacteria bacterium]|nr:hypothetical protein [Actinomycetota bacterium]